MAAGAPMSQRIRTIPANNVPQAGGAAGIPWDETSDGEGRLRPVWAGLSAKLQGLTPEERGNLTASADRMLDDLGTTFNVYSDVGGTGQPYQIDPVPLMIPHDEWEKISAGLAQRMRLMEAVIADLYGPQRLLAKGLIPPDLIHSNRAFQPQVRGVTPQGGRFLVTISSDLIRTPDGVWTVLQDRIQGPQGLGQVLENRNVTSSLLSEHFEASRVARLGHYFDEERAALLDLSSPRAEMPNVVILTSGFRHPSYFEHAYKARLLGFPLVEAADLTVREKRLYLKTLAGLRQIDSVACRLGDDGIDPLEFWTLGRGGVPGIVEAWRSGNVALANAPGTGVASSPALLPFLPRVCRELLGEPLKLPFVETWWLGNAEIRHKVIDQLNRFVLLSTNPADTLLPARWSMFSPSTKKHWLALIEERPHDFVVQLDIMPSQAPSMEGRTLNAKPVLLRGFTLNAKDGPVVLPGGLGRVGKAGQPPQVWPGHEGYTKDVWITDEVGSPIGPFVRTEETPAAVRRHPAASEVPSRIAEQLFWVGRYAERIETATRLLRVTLRRMAGETSRRQRDQLLACLDLIGALGMLPKERKTKTSGMFSAFADLVHGANSRAGLSPLVRGLLSNAAAARDRLSDDTWRFFNKLDGIVHPPAVPPQIPELSLTLDTLILHLSAFSGMQAENMTRGHGWRFMEIGRRLERALGTLSLLQKTAELEDGGSHALDPFLETCDSVMTYRRRHFSKPRWDAVCGLLFSDTTNPRSVAFQIEIIARESKLFPGDPKFGLFPKIMEKVKSLEEPLTNPQPKTSAELEAFGESLEELSDLLTQHYFSHSVRRVY